MLLRSDGAVQRRDELEVRAGQSRHGPREVISVLRKAGGQSRESSDRRRGAYAVGPVEAGCALYGAMIASFGAFALPLSARQSRGGARTLDRLSARSGCLR
jgi:hypothetical protein